MIEATIRILERDANRKGDLFNRLVSDLFLALGYDNIRRNVAKTGREIDLEGRHRTEPRAMIAECKATAEKAGGDAIAKFAGVMDAERRLHPETQIEGYFVSLAGFTETALEQERTLNRLRLLDGTRVVEELIRGHITVDFGRAAETAGRLVASRGFSDLRLISRFELLAHESGWFWAVFFESNHQCTHVALIHADGGALNKVAAERLLKADLSVDGPLSKLVLLLPTEETDVSESALGRVLVEYGKYLAYECGEIQLAGLPADDQVGSRRFELEKLFVPLRLSSKPDILRTGTSYSISKDVLDYVEEAMRRRGLSGADPGKGSNDKHIKFFVSRYLRTKAKAEEWDPLERSNLERPSVATLQQASRRLGEVSVGNAVRTHRHLALLAVPGGGKTTLLKRLAIAYAFPDRMTAVEDDLPGEAWLPVFIRCRQLDGLVRAPMSQIIRSIPERAEFPELQSAWTTLVSQALREGRVLLLVDGLDEIADDSARAAFVYQLRTFLARYPDTRMVLTSRPAGFRIIGGALAGYCKEFQLAEFDNEDIRRLTIAWHKEVVGDRPDVVADAERLAGLICRTDRVRRLATNPLLLTTLLLVKRWVGQLPTRRSALYRKAIEVLLMTWNVEGHQPLDQEEVLPQLAFVALAMMKEGIQRISEDQLRTFLAQARKAMPDLLAYSRLSIAEFIRRVELRSSLLVLVGHDESNIAPQYEFRHLTFQEYLAALAIVEGYYLGHEAEPSLPQLLEPYATDATWREVVPLVAVLAGRKASSLVQWLTDMCRRPDTPLRTVDLLGQCVADEVQANPSIIEDALTVVASRTQNERVLNDLLGSKYGPTMRRVVEKGFLACDERYNHFTHALAVIGLTEMVTGETHSKIGTVTESFAKDPTYHWSADLASLFALVKATSMTLRFPETGQRAWRISSELLTHGEPAVREGACWALSRLGRDLGICPVDIAPIIIRSIAEIWNHPVRPETKSRAAAVLCRLPVVTRGEIEWGQLATTTSPVILEDYGRYRREVKQSTILCAAVVLAYYLRKPWSDSELRNHLRDLSQRKGRHQRLYEALLDEMPIPPWELGRKGRRKGYQG